MVDKLSNYAYFILLKHFVTAKTIAKSFVKEVVKVHGVSKAIISDRDSFFLVTFGKIFFDYKKLSWK